MYIANHYVKVKGNLYTPGEIIPDELDAEKRNRLLEKGAIRLMNALFSKPFSTADANEPNEADQTNEPFEIDAASSISTTTVKKATKRGVKK